MADDNFKGASHRSGYTPTTPDAVLARARKGYGLTNAEAMVLVGEVERLREQRESSVPFQWIDGPPPHPWDREWFLARTTYGDLVVLRPLPEEWTYDFTTADATYIKRDRIAKWAQLPDSQYKPYADERTP